MPDDQPDELLSRMEAIFHEALRLPVSERDRFVEHACRGNGQLRAMVDRLIAADAHQHDVLEESALGGRVNLADVMDLGDEDEGLPGDGVVPPYRLSRRLGAGGMGDVWLAERDDEHFHKRVAIKLIKRGMNTSHILRQFRRERQMLAQLEHPNIARLIDGGSAPDGRPYLVMEYVQGRPITEYCEVEQLALRERIGLLLQVCDAVDDAHRNLIVHRDLKPSNILVTNAGEVKLLDFGIAKVLAGGSATAEVTATMHRALTPRYASPEQVAGTTITTASDVYSLGVILYELLTGVLPYELTATSPSEIERIVCQQEPRRPSTAVDRRPGDSTGTPGLATTCAAPRQLRRLLEGDLDTIILKALRKEPDRRYASARDLAEDLRRHLAGRPVEARPETLVYLTSKFIRRNRVLVGAGAIIAILLLGGIVGIAWQAILASHQRDLAQRRMRDVQQLTTTMLSEVHDAIEALPGATEVRLGLIESAREALDSLVVDAGDDVALLSALADSYERLGTVQRSTGGSDLGDTASALESHAKALELRRRLAQMQPEDTDALEAVSISLGDLGDVHRLSGKREEALRYYNEALEIMTQVIGLVPDDPEAQRRLAVTHVLVGSMQQTQGAYDRALASYTQGRDIVDKAMQQSPEHDELQRTAAVCREKIGDIRQIQGDAALALQMYRESMVYYRALAEREPNNTSRQMTVAIAYSKLSNVLGHPSYANVGDVAGALEAAVCGRDIVQTLVDADPVDARAARALGVFHRSVGLLLAELGRLEEALASQERALAIAERLSNADPLDVLARRDVAWCFGNMGQLLAQMGRYEEAIERLLHGREMHRQLWEADPDHVELRTDLAYNSMALAEIHEARASESEDPGSAWRLAREYYADALEHLRTLEMSQSLIAIESQRTASLTDAVERCDAALSELQGP